MVVQAPPQSKPLWLQLPQELTLRVTLEQFVMLAAANRELRLERTATGELIVNPPTGGNTGYRNLSITGQLSVWYEANDTLGRAFDSSTGFELPNGANPPGSPSGFVSCSTWGDPKTALTHQLLYLGRPQDPYGFSSRSWGKPPRPRCFTARGVRAVAPLLGETPRPHWFTVDPYNVAFRIYVCVSPDRDDPNLEVWIAIIFRFWNLFTGKTKFKIPNF